LYGLSFKLLLAFANTIIPVFFNLFEIYDQDLGDEAFTAVTMQNVVFWDLASCGS
jgi:hypothetical protein